MAMDMFMKVGTLNGESRDKTYAKWIDVLAWSWGASNSGSAHSGGGAGSGKANVQDISFTKYIDSSTPDLLTAVCTGSHYDTANLVVRKAGGTPVEYIKIDIAEVLVTSVSQGGSGGEDRLTENVTLNFAKIKFTYTPQDATGKAGTAIPMSYNVAENVKE